MRPTELLGQKRRGRRKSVFKFGVKLGLGFTGIEFPPKLDFWNNL